MTTSELLQQVRVINPVTETDKVADVLLVNGAIAAVESNISHYPATTQVRDCREFVLGPGLVDLYSHCGEPGFEERETLVSLCLAAAAGGFTRLNILPDTLPPIDNLSGLARLVQGLERLQSAPEINFWAALTVGLQGQQMTELAELAAAPSVVGFADGLPIENLALLRRLLEYLKPLKKPVVLWACSRQLVGNGVMRDGVDSTRLGLPGNPAMAETAAVASLLELVAAIDTPVHIMRVSCARSVELIAQAKSRGLPITASTTWMHLVLDTKAVYSYSSNLRIEPPLGNATDVAALRHGVRTGVVDAIAVDHTPYTYEEKTVAFAEAPPGAIGLELALPLLWQNLVETGELSAIQLWRCLSTRPAECLQQTPTTITPQQPANLTLFHPHKPWTVDRNSLKSLSVNTHWVGKQLHGRVIKTWN